MSKTVSSGTKIRKKVVNVLIHILLAILAFIWVFVQKKVLM